MMRAHVVIAWHDYQAGSITSYITVGEAPQKIEGFLILLSEFRLWVRCIGANALDYIGADDDQVGGSHRRRFFRRVMPPVVFKSIQKNVVSDRIVRITMQIG